MAATALALSTVGAPGQAYAQDCTAPDGNKGSVIFNDVYDVFQGCTARGWQAFHPMPIYPCTETVDPPEIGETCTDGSVYAGLSPDGNEPMYTTPADAPSATWGSSGTTRGTTSVTAGETNTTTLAGFGASAHPAAHYCDSLSAHGSDDWYLPAKDELAVLHANNVAIGAFGTGFYWSSSEYAINFAWYQRFSDGSQSYTTGNNVYAVRCVRR